MSNDNLDHKVRIALRAAQMKKKIVPSILLEIYQRIEDLHEEYVGEKKDEKDGWPIFKEMTDWSDSSSCISYDGMSGTHITDYYRRHYEIVSFLEGVGVLDVKAEELSQLYHKLKERDQFQKREYKSWQFARNSSDRRDKEFDAAFRKSRYHDGELEDQGEHFIHLPTRMIFHYECAHEDTEIGENEVRGYPQAFEDLKATPWFHNQHPIFNTMNYKAKLFLICLEVGDLLNIEHTEHRALPGA